MLSTLKIAAVALASFAGLSYFAGPPPVAATFAEVAQKLHDARTLVYRASSTTPRLKGPMRAKLYFKEPGLMRSEMEVAGGSPVTILDSTRARMVILDAARKSAILMEDAKPGEDVVAKTVDFLRNLSGKKGEPAGRERIGGVEAEGVSVERPAGAMLVWYDPKTRLPLRIDVTDRVGGEETKATLTDFEIDADLDPALFRVDPPAGYSVQKLNGAALFESPEAAVSKSLRAYAAAHGGGLPVRLEDPAAFESIFPKEQDKALFDGSDPKRMELLMSVGRAMSMRLEVKGYGYKADGVKLGDAGKIVFWYRPEGSEKYRALYGDLHVGDIDADALPEKPKP